MPDLVTWTDRVQRGARTDAPLVPDVITQIGRSLVQHGKHNDRIYLMKLAREDLPGIVTALHELGVRRDYSKIFVKAPGFAREAFVSAGYEVEASVPGFFGGVEEGLFLGKFLDPRRGETDEVERIDAVLTTAHRKAAAHDGHPPPLPAGLELSVCGADDCPRLAALYAEVFATYPFPIHDPDYLRETMRTHIVYFGVTAGAELVAAASAEMDVAAGNVEMTDFATLPRLRGKRFASALLARMEQEMRARGIATAFTVARAASFGMNVVFARAGYAFGGTLINNTQISGRLESMNVWSKPISQIERAASAL